MELKMIDMKKIHANPLQPRQEFDREKLQELANSIREAELLQPIVVREDAGEYELVAGERRFKAFQILKEPKIPSIVRVFKDDTDVLEKSLIENLQRDDLTSIERENAVGSLWESKRYETKRELAKKLGIKENTVGTIINAKEDRERLSSEETISTRTLGATAGLDDKPRKKLLDAISDGKIEPTKVDDVTKKLREFSEPEQQLEILEDFEDAEEQTKEVFDDIIQKKKEIAEGIREPEHTIEIESDSDKRMLDDYKDIKSRVFDIYSNHIKHLNTEESKQEAIEIIQEIITYLNKQLVELEVIKEVNI